MKRAAAIALIMLAACGRPKPPLSVKRCDAVASPHGFTLSADVQNDSTKPISGMRLTVDFYHDFRYTRLVGSTQLHKELDPGQRRVVTLDVGSPGTAQGEAMRCSASHIDYLDGTSADFR